MNIVDSYINSLTRWLDNINLLGILTIIIIGIIIYKLSGPVVGWIVRHILSKKVGETKIERIEREKRVKTLSNLFSAIAKGLVALTTVFTVLSDIGINLAPVIASAGIAGVALGFGAQNIVKDMLAGFFIILENQYRVGDVVEISGIGFPASGASGTVTDISLRRTTLRDREGNVHIIPNGNINEVINRTLGYSRFRFTFAVDNDTNVDQIIEMVNEVGQDLSVIPKWNKLIVTAPHYDELGKIGKAGVNITVSGTTLPGHQWEVSSEFRKRLVMRLQKSDIEIADVES